jgi:hypothetical protein
MTHETMKTGERKLQAEVHSLESNDHCDWATFAKHKVPDPYDDYGWFQVTVGTAGIHGDNDFQVCVATPRAVSRLRQAGMEPGILVDNFDAATVRKAIVDRVSSVSADTWEQIVDELRKFMHWEYEGM